MLQHRSSPTLCPTWAAGQPVLSLHLLLPLSIPCLDLRNALAGGTCPSITWQQLLNPSCCQQTCSTLLPWVPCTHRCSLSSTCGSSSFAESPEKGDLFAVPLNQPGSGPKPRWSLQAHGCKVHGWGPRWGWSGQPVPIDRCPWGPNKF